MLKNVNALAKNFNTDTVQIGTAIHFKKVNKWGPSLLKKTNQPMMLWDPTDSPDTEEAYKNDTIDAIHIYILEDKAKVHKEVYRKPKKEVDNTKVVNKNIFKK